MIAERVELGCKRHCIANVVFGFDHSFIDEMKNGREAMPKMRTARKALVQIGEAMMSTNDERRRRSPLLYSLMLVSFPVFKRVWIKYAFYCG